MSNSPLVKAALLGALAYGVYAVVSKAMSETYPWPQIPSTKWPKSGPVSYVDPGPPVSPRPTTMAVKTEQAALAGVVNPLVGRDPEIYLKTSFKSYAPQYRETYSTPSIDSIAFPRRKPPNRNAMDALPTIRSV